MIVLERALVIGTIFAVMWGLIPHDDPPDPYGRDKIQKYLEDWSKK